MPAPGHIRPPEFPYELELLITTYKRLRNAWESRFCASTAFLYPSSLIPTDPKYDFTMGPGTWVSPVSLYRLLGWNGKVQQLELKEPDGVLALKGCQAEKCLDVNGKLIKHLHFFFLGVFEEI